jgi:chromosome segregation ATPase
MDDKVQTLAVAEITKENEILKKRVDELNGLFEKSKEFRVLHYSQQEIKKLRTELDVIGEQKLQNESLKNSIHSIISTQDDEIGHLKNHIKSLIDQIKENGLTPKKSVKESPVIKPVEEVNHIQKTVILESEIAAMKEGTKKWNLERTNIRIEIDETKTQNLELKSQIEVLKNANKPKEEQGEAATDFKAAAKNWWAKTVEKTAVTAPTISATSTQELSKASTAELSKDLDKVQKLEKELNSLKTNNQYQIQHFESEIVVLKDQSASQDNIIAAQSSQIISLKETITKKDITLKETLSKLESMKKDALPNLPDKSVDLETKIQKLENEIVGLKSKNNSQDMIIADKVAEISHLQENIDNITKETISNNETDAITPPILTDQTSNIQTLEIQINKLGNEIVGLKSQIASQDGILAIKLAQIESLHEEQLKNNKSEIALKDTIANLESTIKTHELKESQIIAEQNLSSTKKSAEQLQQNTSLQLKYQEKETECNSLLTDKQANEKEIKKLKLQIKTNKEEGETFSKSLLDQVDHLLAENTKTRSELKQQFEFEKKKLQSNFEVKEEEFEVEKNELEKKNIKLVQKVEEDTVKIWEEKVKKSVANEAQTKRDLEFLKKDLDSKIKEFDVKVEKLKTSKTQEIDVLKKNYTQLESEHQVLKHVHSETEETMAKINQFKEDSVKAKDSLKELEQKYNLLKQEEEVSSVNYTRNLELLKEQDVKLKSFVLKITDLETLRDSNTQTITKLKQKVTTQNELNIQQTETIKTLTLGLEELKIELEEYKSNTSNTITELQNSIKTNQLDKETLDKKLESKDHEIAVSTKKFQSMVKDLQKQLKGTLHRDPSDQPTAQDLMALKDVNSALQKRALYFEDEVFYFNIVENI